MGGVYATRPAQGPHKLRESIPLTLVLKNKLKYALTGQEVKVILKDPSNKVLVDGKVRRYFKFPVGLMDIITIPKTEDKLRVFYDVKGRFTLVPLKKKEANVKLAKVVKKFTGPNGIPYIVTHDARTIRFAEQKIKNGDVIGININSGEIVSHFKQEVGNIALAIGGNNKGRIGIVTTIVRKPGKMDVITLKDANGSVFTTRLANIFIIGSGKKTSISLPKGKGLKVNIVDQIETEAMSTGRTSKKRFRRS